MAPPRSERRREDASPRPSPLVLFIDIDDTLVRSFGSKRISMTPVIDRIRNLHAEGAVLYAWSSGGAEYVASTLADLGLTDCFVAWLPKPQVFVDDVRVEAWRTAIQLHPNEVQACSVDDLERLLAERGVVR